MPKVVALQPIMNPLIQLGYNIRDNAHFVNIIIQLQTILHS